MQDTCNDQSDQAICPALSEGIVFFHIRIDFYFFTIEVLKF